MRVYLAKYDIFEDFYGELCEPYCDSKVFTDFGKARQFLKDSADCWLKLNEYIKDDGELNEGDKEIQNVSFDITIIERDTEDEGIETDWHFDYKCELKWGYEKTHGREGYFYPGDELPGAGTMFSIGDFVTRKESDKYSLRQEPKVFLVTGAPGKRGEDTEEGRAGWENTYTLEYVTEHGYWEHAHEPEYWLKTYTGIIPTGLNIMRKIYMGEAKITVKRLREVFGSAFTDNEYVKRDIERLGLNEESLAPADLIKMMLYEGELILPNNPTYRDVALEDIYP